MDAETREWVRALRPNTAAWRVFNSIRGPDRGVDPGWWRTQFGATGVDVSGLSSEDLFHALRMAGAPLGPAIPDDRAGRAWLAQKLGFLPKGWKHEKPTKQKRWDEMSAREKEDAIDVAQESYGEAGLPMSRKHAAQLLRRRFA